jgi:hypothetical protein
MQTTLTKRPPRTTRDRLVGLLVFVGSLGLSGSVVLTAMMWFHFEEVRRSEEDFQRKLARIEAGQLTELTLYDSTRTDQLLTHLQDNDSVESLMFDLTDVTDEGMKCVASFSRLRSLTIKSGRPGITNAGLAELSRNKSIESLDLCNTKVTDDGLAVLKDFENLKELTLYWEEWRSVRLTDAGVVHLKGLDKLETLSLHGGWASPAAVAKLKKSLPNCKITRTDVYKK